MTITTYQCDRCHKKSKDKALVAVTLEARPTSTLPRHLDSTYLRIELCEECAVASGVVRFKKDPDKPMQMSPQDQLYNILYDIVSEMQSNQ